MAIEFQEFPKIPRYRREVAISEKIDGTNACVRWEPHDINVMNETALAITNLTDQHGVDLGPYELHAQSRSKFIVPGKNTDNYGFASWVKANFESLRALGPGAHYGEWWGQGIQRGYGLTEKRFSLFNVNRWGAERQPAPACCHVVPLFGYYQPDQIASCVIDLQQNGSRAAPGYMTPEGIIVWHSQSKQYYKILLENDDTPKSQSK